MVVVVFVCILIHKRISSRLNSASLYVLSSVNTFLSGWIQEQMLLFTVLFPLTGHHWCNVTLTDEGGSPGGKLKITRLNHYLQTQWKHINAPTEIQTRPELHCHCTSNVCRGHTYDVCLQCAPTTSQLMCPSDPRHFKAAKCNQLYP